MILSTGGGGAAPGDACSWRGVCSQGDAWSWGVPGLGRCAWSGRGVPAPGVPGGDPPGKATAAGGTHPTGMHSCD